MHASVKRSALACIAVLLMIGIRVGGKGGSARDARGPGGGSASGGGSGEPSFNGGTDTLLLSDGFESYTTGSDIVSGLWTDAQGSVSIVTGRAGGASKAARLTWPVNTGQQPISNLILEDVLGSPQHIIVQWWYRLAPTGIHMEDSGMKWFEVWRNDIGGNSQPRWTNGVGQLTSQAGPPGFIQTGLMNEFTVHDNAWTPPDYAPFCQNIDKGGRWSDTNDGNWHRITYEIWLLASKGIRWWTDGVLRGSTFDGAPGVPSGGMNGGFSSTISILKFGDVNVDPPSPNGGFTIDYDDFLIWSTP